MKLSAKKLLFIQVFKPSDSSSREYKKEGKACGTATLAHSCAKNV